MNTTARIPSIFNINYIMSVSKERKKITKLNSIKMIKRQTGITFSLNHIQRS